MGHSFGEPGFGTISMHAGITAITELAVKSGLTNRLPYWETIPDISAKPDGVGAMCDSPRTTNNLCAEAHRNGKRFVARADEKFTAFAELESAMRVYCELV